jgi:hypothetical protein
MADDNWQTLVCRDADLSLRTPATEGNEVLNVE